MDNQVIKVLNEKHGEQVINYFKSLGINTSDYKGHCTSDANNSFCYYGLIDGYFSNFSKSVLLNSKVELITLPKPNSYPKVMYVSDFKDDFKDKRKRVVFIEKGGRFLAWVGAETLEEAEVELNVMEWRYAIDIPEETPEVIVELTMKDISEGKGVGIAPHLIRIKE